MTLLDSNYSEDDIIDQSGREKKEHGNLSFPVAFYTPDITVDPFHLHWHEKLECGYIMEGAAYMLADGRKIFLKEGDGFFINTCIPHFFESADISIKTVMQGIVFDPIIVGGQTDTVFWQKLVKPVIKSTSMPCLILEAENEDHKQVISLLSRACHAYRVNEDFSEIEVRYALSHLLAVVRQQLPKEQPAESRRIARDNERILVMLNYIQKHYADTISAEDIAASAMISESECLRCFYNTIGITPVQYMIAYRVQKASELLRSTNEPIAAIAASCGFQEMSYFAKTFNKYMKSTPRDYRKRYENME